MTLNIDSHVPIYRNPSRSFKNMTSCIRAALIGLSELGCGGVREELEGLDMYEITEEWF